MKILMLNHEYPPIGGGSGVAMKYLAEALVAIGHEVVVLTVAQSEQSYDEGGVRIVRFPITMQAGKLASLKTWSLFLWHAPKYLKSLVREFKPDIINSHFVFPSGYVVARSGLRLPHVTSVVGADIYDPTRKLSAESNWIVRKLVRIAAKDAVVMTTPSTDLTLRTKNIFPDVDVETISWGVPNIEVVENSRSLLGIPENAFVISSLCRLVRRKRLDLLLNAVAKLQEEHLIVAIMGYGPEEETLRNQARLLKIERQIRIIGKVSEKEKSHYLNASNIFCLPSDHEGFGLVFIEAMSVGTPIITTSVGGQNDIIRDGIEGFLVPVNNEKVLCDRIKLLMNKPTLLSKMSRKSRDRANKFVPQSTAEAFSTIYTNALKKNMLK